MTATLLLRFGVLGAYPDDEFTPDIPVALTVFDREPDVAVAAAASLDFGDGTTAVELRLPAADGEEMATPPMCWVIVPGEVDWCADGETVTAVPDVDHDRAVANAADWYAASDPPVMVLGVWPVP